MYLNRIIKTRFGGVVLFSFIFLALSLTIRTVLLITDWQNTEMSILRFVQIYTIGFFYDIIALSYFIIPFVLYLLIIPNRIFQSKIHRWVSYLFFIIAIGIVVFSSTGEWFFWEEFSVRYNFIAVDYLVYTHEVIKNIRESYPMPLIITGMLTLSAIIFFSVRKYFDLCINSNSKFSNRLAVSMSLLAIPVLAFFTVNKSTAEIKDNTYCNELAHNGIYQIFSAFRNNELDYKTFYQSQDDKKAFVRLRQLISTPNSRFLSDDVFDVTREITSPEQEIQYNVVLITVESLSGSFFTRFGNKNQITPNMDTIARKSLFFTNFFATGTRTVRGMEALTTSLPPTPGYSIVKRPNNENMFTLGNVLKKKGYDNHFIYAGYGYFDNMNYFFGNNGYQIVDHTDFTEQEITFENAWGVCDEDLFSKALQVSDKAYEQGKPFHNFIMTTSNHRPYTYPEGRIDIPSHSGRKGAVKYTDYAIAKFLREARKKPWFSKTLFVIVADHCASSAGKSSLPIKKYHIPLMVYAPAIISPKEVNTLSSQIDVAPTLLGLMNMNYTSKFFGKDILRDTPNRALLGTYQKIGLLHNNNLTVQIPTKRAEGYKIENDEQIKVPVNTQELKDAITYYQTASYLFHNKKYNFQ